MAKNKNKNQDKKRKKSILPLLFILLVFLVPTIFIGFNLFSFRDKYFYKAIKNVPILNGLVPQDVENADTRTKEEILAENEELKLALEKTNKQLEEFKNSYEDRGDEIARLLVYEKERISVQEQKKEIDNLIVSNNYKEFATYYKNINPENADRLYREAVQVVNKDKDRKKLFSNFSTMDEEDAAKILELMLNTQSNVVLDILKNVDTEKSATILASMQTENAASITKMLYDASNVQ